MWGNVLFPLLKRKTLSVYYNDCLIVTTVKDLKTYRDKELEKCSYVASGKHFPIIKCPFCDEFCFVSAVDGSNGLCSTCNERLGY